MAGGPAGFNRDFTCPGILRKRPRARDGSFAYRAVTLYGPAFHPCSTHRTARSEGRQTLTDHPYNPAEATAAAYHASTVWAVPRSLAATEGISVDFFSSGYLDVSVPRVRHCTLCIQMQLTHLCGPGCPIRKSPGQSLFVSSPGLIADYHVLHRLLSPRHPPCALSHLTI